MIKLDFNTMEWLGNRLRLIDQRKLPGELSYFNCRTTHDFVYAIKNLVVRGAPAIGITAAYGMIWGECPEVTACLLKSTRPTAVNLSWAVDRMLGVADLGMDRMEQEAESIHREDALACENIGKMGFTLINDGANILTYCNAGALATGGIGTALGVIYTAYFSGKRIHVWVSETRPVLQGARLTAWELNRAGVPHTLICDNMAASLMAQGKVDCVIVGADRIAENGDVANKIGTYNLAVLCAYHKIPFYVAAPTSTFDKDCHNGSHIVIEQRSSIEVFAGAGSIYNPAFDVTPHDLITSVITENGIWGTNTLR